LIVHRQSRMNNQEWTIQRHRQHWSQETEQINVREKRKDNQKWTIQRHRQHWSQDTEWRQAKGQSRMDNPKTPTTLVTRHRTNKR
jgi:hypothetical protein